MLRAFAFFGMDEAMIDVVIDKRALGAGDSILDRLELLRDIDAGPLLLDHPNDAAKMTGSPVQPLDDRRMTSVSVMSHIAL